MLATKHFIVLIVHLLQLLLASSVRVVEVPPDLHNLTYDYEDEPSTENGVQVPGKSSNANETKVTVTVPSTEAPRTQLKQEHPCNRQCPEKPKPMICRYDFHVEYYLTMSKACYDCPFNITHCTLKDCIPADGVKRPITVVNRQLPGPSIEVCHGDIVEVEVDNWLFDEATSIHWHGQHQRESQFMDGVPYVTQCPITPKSSFLYRFEASVPGTHFWHSHSAFQRGDGVFGPLIVRLPSSQDQYSDLFDYDLSDHVISITDWTHVLGLTKFAFHHHSDGDNKPASILVNGKGRYQEFEDEFNEVLYTPMEEFTVTQGFRYRFRLINAGFLNCPIEMSVDNHTLVVISGDGADLEPIEAQSLVSYAGERFDFIIQMNQPVDNYWIRFRGLMDCDERFNSVIQTAVLHYEGAESDIPDPEVAYDIKPEGLQVNSVNAGLNTSDTLIMPELRSTTTSRRDPRLKTKADVQFYISYDFYPKDNTHFHTPHYYGFYQVEKSHRLYTPQLNHITMKFPSFPLMANLEEAKKLNFCNSTNLPKACETSYCECTHLLTVPKDSVVELLMVDKGFTFDANHPFHLHGYNFRVIGMDRLGSNVTDEKIKELDRKGLLMRNLKDAPIKDTVTVPDGGYTILRWHATNPGFWLFHCHIEFHVELGMALVFKVGEDEDFPSKPKNFPQCNHYYPIESIPAVGGDDQQEEIITYKPYEKDDNNIVDIIFNAIEDNFLKVSSHSAPVGHSSGLIHKLSNELILLCLGLIHWIFFT